MARRRSTEGFGDPHPQNSQTGGAGAAWKPVGEGRWKAGGPRALVTSPHPLSRAQRETWCVSLSVNYGRGLGGPEDWVFRSWIELGPLELLREGTSPCTLAEGAWKREVLHSRGAGILGVQGLGFGVRRLPGFHLSREPLIPREEGRSLPLAGGRGVSLDLMVQRRE